MKLFKMAFAAGAAVLLTGSNANWNNTVTETHFGHLIGNPDAKTQLTEFISYTCGHCAHFADQGDPVLKLAYIHPGKLKVEIRHLLRDPLDLTAAMLAQCGDASKFTLNHAAFMSSQSTWLGKAQQASQAQIARWTGPDRAAARRSIASDLGFYDIMERRGYNRPDVDRCLNDNSVAFAFAEASSNDVRKYGLSGTPSFLINDQLQDHVHNWQSLEPKLNAQIALDAE